ncbi:DNA-directed RNA polymerase subunit B'' [archaeon]|nr:DNA-directed RNA polymerase subunit B'' [archaeon]
MDKSILIKKYFEEKKFVESSIRSFNNFIDLGLKDVIEENKEAEPNIIPHNIESFKIRFGKITVGNPQIIEADGSRRPIYPSEARLRKISYSAPIFLEISSYINDVQRENFQAEVGKLPIMLRSKYCNLKDLSREDLITKGEDPNDPGGYFIINGTERVLVTIEDLAENNFVIEKDQKTGLPSGRIFSAQGSYKIPHQLNFNKKDGIAQISFTRIKEVPIVVLLKALGMLKDEEIMKEICGEESYEDILINLFEFADVRSTEDAFDTLARKSGFTQTKEVRVERAIDMIDKYLLPHIGRDKASRSIKAKNLCKMFKKLIRAKRGEIPFNDKDHYGNKRLRLSGDLLLDLFRANFKLLVNDILYNFQRIIKRGKLPSIRVIIRDKLLTSRIYSSMATGEWVGGRQGVSQRIDRANFLGMVSHLQKVNSPLSSSQENFEARALHCTHIGRLCPIETPEGTNIGLRKNMAMLCSISQGMDDSKLLEKIKELGVKEI